jgi:hypothetical protein
MNVLNKQIQQSLVCMVAVSVLLQLVLPMVIEPFDEMVSQIPFVGKELSDVLGSHRDKKIGGAVAVALITIAAAFLAPILCPMVNL